MKNLVLVRPEPGASAGAAAARALGLAVVVLPLFEIRAVPWQAPEASGYEALLITSANAVRHGGEQLDRFRVLPVAAVGRATAGAARAAGFRVRWEGEMDVAALLAAMPPGLRLLHLAGRDRAEAGSGETIDAITVYYAAPLPAPEHLETVSGAVVALHSPRAARRFDQLLGERGIDRSSVEVVTLSSAVARAAGSGWRRIEIASQPTDAALLALAAGLCLSADE